MMFAYVKLVPEFCNIRMKTKSHKFQNESQRTFFKNIHNYHSIIFIQSRHMQESDQAKTCCLLLPAFIDTTIGNHTLPPIPNHEQSHTPNPHPTPPSPSAPTSPPRYEPPPGKPSSSSPSSLATAAEESENAAIDR